ncbi:hypothetical protein HRH25_20500 [Flavisolibacter sp. BT320]|nr:hypothetical protein [Flavisolibacter longurius]
MATNQELDYQDLAGELYLTVSSILGLTGTSGKVYKLVLEKLKNVK